MKKLFKPLMLACLLTVGATAAHAQDANVDPMTAHHWPMDSAKRDAMMAKHMQKMHDTLKIQPAQEAAWKDFVASMKPMNPPKPSADDAKLSAPDRMEKGMKMNQEQMQQRLDALKTFYKQLTPEQQKIMDGMHARMGQKPRN